MPQPEKVVPSLAPMPCPAYLVAAYEDGGGWEVAAHRVLFAQHDGERARLLVCHPAYGGLVPADVVAADHPAVLLVDPTAEELEEARLLVRAKAVAGGIRRDLAWARGGEGRPWPGPETPSAWPGGRGPGAPSA